jgi:hypothetical protein
MSGLRRASPRRRCGRRDALKAVASLRSAQVKRRPLPLRHVSRLGDVKSAYRKGDRGRVARLSHKPAWRVFALTSQALTATPASSSSPPRLALNRLFRALYENILNQTKLVLALNDRDRVGVATPSGPLAAASLDPNREASYTSGLNF